MGNPKNPKNAMRKPSKADASALPRYLGKTAINFIKLIIDKADNDRSFYQAWFKNRVTLYSQIASENRTF